MAETNDSNDTRAAVQAAIQEHEQTEASAPVAPVSPEPTSTPSPPERTRDEAGKFAQKPQEPKPAAEQQSKPETPPVARAEEQSTASGEQKPQEPARAGPPRNVPLPPKLREQWDTIPEPAREYILKREGEVSRVLSQTAEARRTAESFVKTLEPYRDMLTGEPMQVVGGLLQTAAVLQRGSPHEKAQVLAQVLSGYHVDKTDLVARIIEEQGVDIEQLAGRLERGGPTTQQAPHPYRDPRVDALEQRLAREDAARLQSARQEAAASYKTFAENAEFLDSPGVREAMEREMRAAAAQGVVMELQDAYDRVVWALKDTREVLLERERSRPVGGTATSQAAIQRAKHAASSVKNEPSMARVTTDNSVEANIRALLG